MLKTKKVPIKLRKAGNIHKYMEWAYKQNKKALKKANEKYRLIDYLINKYNVKDGLAYAEPKNWDKKDKEIFIKIWVMSGYSEKVIKRMYKLY